MSSGLIYAVIVGLWAVVLVPMWLRRHDEVSESRSVDRFQGAMRTLSRRSATGDRREVLRHRHSPPAAARPDGVAASAASASASPGRPADPAARRRRSLLVLAGVLLLVGVLVVVGVAPWWAAVLPAVLLGAFVARARVAARRRTSRELQERRARAAAARRRRDAAVASRYRQSVGAAPRADLAVAVAADVAVDIAVPAAEPVRPALESEPLYDAVAERVWEPVPVPLPTYVTAPKAPRSVRVIDLTQPGSWTSGHLTEDEQPVVPAEAAAVRDPDSIVTGELLVERRRAVND
ncbi:MAG: hypothetical protein MUC45_05620 [Actinomycetia bacterium]|nr:hypothetical protein [Actinomycetes bacterium]